MKKFIAVLLFSFGLMAAQSQGVVISQVYGGGGNSGSVYTNDFIELFNASASPVSLNGWSVQYNSATGTGAWQVTNLNNFTLQPGQYYLIQQAAGTGGTTPLPTPNTTGTIAMSGTAGKIVLVNNTTALTGCPTTTGYVDLVGFGATANCFEGAAAPAPSNSNSIIRGSNGCLDNNQNGTDFTAVTAAPRNSTTTLAPCGAPVPTLTATPSPLNFANTNVGSNSTELTFSLSGSSLTGAPGNITVTAPSTDFQVSNNNSTWGPTTTVAYSAATLSANMVYVRFTPQTSGLKNGNVSIAGGGVATAVTVAVSGTGVVPTPTITAGTVADFGNIVLLNNSTSQSFNITGTNLAGAPGNITVTAPSTDFQVSNNNSTWGPSTTIAYTAATLAATPVYVRFTPQTVGFKSGNVSITGGGVATAVTVAVSGTCVAAPIPSIATSTITGFGSLCLNTTGGPNNFTITGTNLTTANITVAALSGYVYATAAAGPYTSSLSLTQAGGSYSQVIYVQFTPTAAASYNGNIAVGGGGTPTAANVAVTGTGVNTVPSPTTAVASAITAVSATTAGSIATNGCTAVTAYGIEYSTTNNFVPGTGTQVAGSNIAGGNFTVALSGLSPATVYFFRAYAINAGGTGYGTQLSFLTATPFFTSTALAAFGSICVNTTSTANSFTINGTNLTAANVVVGPRPGYTFATTANGTYAASLSITQPGGSAFSQQVFVKVTPTAVGSLSGNIFVGGGGAPVGISVPATAAGINTTATVTTGAATVATPNKVGLAGTVDNIGCSAVTGTGFVYSSISGFANYNGTSVPSSSATGGSFTANVDGLVQGAAYYYKAYATNSGGTSYGAEQSFTMKTIPIGLVLYATPIQRGGRLHFTLSNIKPGHYAAQIINRAGQIVFQKDMIVGVNFIDETITLPGILGSGVYTLHVGNIETGFKKTFMIW